MNKLLLVLCTTVFLAMLMPNATAHFVCGQVNDSDEGMSSAWFSVKLYYTGKPTKYASCDVSPEDKKFCCDADAIPPQGTWRIGKSVSARIFDLQAGYVSDPVSVTTTGEGYDVLPLSQLEKVIKVNQEIERIIIANHTRIPLDLSFKEPYTHIELQQGENKTTLCTNCTMYNAESNATRGMNYWSIFASNPEDTFTENIVFASLSGIDFQKEVACSGCIGTRARENNTVSVELNLRPSNEITAMRLIEYVPIQWKVIDTSNGTISKYSQSHNTITWNVSGQDITRSYTIQTPNVEILPVRYTFKTELENIDLAEDERIVYSIIPFFPKRLSNSFFKLGNRTRGTINKKKPLVLDQGSMLIAIYPKKRIRGAQINLGNISTDGLSNVIRAYEIQTNLQTKDIKELFIEIKESKTELAGQGYKEVGLYMFNESWQKYRINFSYEDESFVHYKAIVPPSQGIALVGIKESDESKPSLDDVLNDFFLPTVNERWFERPNKVQAIMRYLFFYYLRNNS